MPLKTKYQPVLDLLNEFNAKEIHSFEERGYLVITCTVNDEHKKKMILEKIKEINNEVAHDIKVSINVE